MSFREAIGLVLGFGIGVACRLAGLPLPAPEALLGAVLVLALTLGYVLADRVPALAGTARGEGVRQAREGGDP